MARQQRDVRGLVGLLALGVEELAQLAARGADEQGGTVDLDRVDPPASGPGADARLQLDRTALGRDRGAAHDPLAAGGEDLQQTAGQQAADRVLLVAGEPEADRLVVEARAGVEVERMAGLGEPQAVRQIARAADDQPLLVDRDAGRASRAPR